MDLKKRKKDLSMLFKVLSIIVNIVMNVHITRM